MVQSLRKVFKLLFIRSYGPKVQSLKKYCRCLVLGSVAQWYSPSKKYLSCILLGALAQWYSPSKSFVEAFLWELWPNGTVPQKVLKMLFFRISGRMIQSLKKGIKVVLYLDQPVATWYRPKKNGNHFSLKAVAQWYSFLKSNAIIFWYRSWHVLKYIIRSFGLMVQL